MLSDPGGVRASHPFVTVGCPVADLWRSQRREALLMLRPFGGSVSITGRDVHVDRASTGLSYGQQCTRGPELDDQMPGVFSDQKSGWLLGLKGGRCGEVHEVRRWFEDTFSARTDARSRRYRVESTRSPKTHRFRTLGGLSSRGRSYRYCAVGDSSHISFDLAENC